MCDEYERLTHARPHGSSAIHFFLSKDVPMDEKYDEKRGGGGACACSGILVVVLIRCSTCTEGDERRRPASSQLARGVELGCLRTCSTKYICMCRQRDKYIFTCTSMGQTG